MTTFLYRCPYAFRFKATHPSRTSDNNSAYEVTCLAWRRVHAVNLFWRHAWIARNKLRFVRLLAALVAGWFKRVSLVARAKTTS